jgi:hypothetical protein
MLAPAKGRAFDRIGLGIKFDSRYRKSPEMNAAFGELVSGPELCELIRVGRTPSSAPDPRVRLLIRDPIKPARGSAAVQGDRPTRSDLSYEPWRQEN